MKQQIYLNGVGVYPFESFEELISSIEGQNKILVAVNLLKMMKATEQTCDIINRNIGYADGVAVQLALESMGHGSCAIIPGCELWLKIIARNFKKSSFYLIGATDEVVNKTVLKLKSEFDGINIVNYRNGYVKTEEEKKAVIEDILLKKPDYVFVAMGSPRQELFMEEMSRSHAAIYQGLGGSFDVYVGAVNRAPDWWLDNKLEAAYRIIKQPKRLKELKHFIRFYYKLLTKSF